MQSSNQGQRTWRLIAAIVLIILLTPFLYLQYKSLLRQENALPEQSVQEETKGITPKVSEQDMVNLAEFIPGIEVDLKYATPDNFTGAIIYDDKAAYLRRGTAEKLKAAQAEFATHGYTVKVWDAYRPPAAQFKLWEKVPDARFVINPHKGFSYHSRGIAVDITLVDKNGQEVVMPTGFDNFTARADRDYSDLDSETEASARFLEEIMVKHGFNSIHYEWWHFIDSDKDEYPVYEPELE
ncbi:MAG TPA: peptidase M15 [Syntrophomonas sp.]|jgi:D-alanyl-D-alanine dipeptidase|nr:peptidase M15 [Syntrophomonas sp.]